MSDSTDLQRTGYAAGQEWALNHAADGELEAIAGMDGQTWVSIQIDEEEYPTLAEALGQRRSNFSGDDEWFNAFIAGAAEVWRDKQQ